MPEATIYLEDYISSSDADAAPGWNKATDAITPQGGTIMCGAAQYRMLSQPLNPLPIGTTLNSECPARSPKVFAAGGGSMFILPPGVSLTGKNPAGAFWNPLFTSSALTLSEGCKVSNMGFLSSRVSMNLTTATQAEFQTQSFATNGNAIQINGGSTEIDHVAIFGFDNGILNASSTVDASGNVIGVAAGDITIAHILGDGNNLINLSRAGLGGTIDKIVECDFLKPSQVSGSNLLNFTVGSDGASGTLLTLTTWNSLPIVWANQSHPIIGNPIANATITLSMFDTNGSPSCATSPIAASNRYTGQWVPNAASTGWNIRLPNVSPLGWVTFGAAPDGSGLGATLAPSTPCSAAFTAVAFRNGSVIVANQVHSMEANGIKCLGSGITVQDCGGLHFSNISADAPCWDYGGPQRGFAFRALGNTSGYTIDNSYNLNCGGGLDNQAQGRPGGGCSLVGFDMGGPGVPLNHQGNSIHTSSCKLGKSGPIIMGAAHKGFSFDGTLPTLEQDGGTLTIISAPGALKPYFSPGCIGTPPTCP